MRNRFLTLLLLLTATLSIQAQQMPNAVLKSISEKLEKDCCSRFDSNRQHIVCRIGQQHKRVTKNKQRVFCNRCCALQTMVRWYYPMDHEHNEWLRRDLRNITR